MKRFVLVFVFDWTLSNVILIDRKKPTGQPRGLDGLGGEVLEGEGPGEAARRLVRAETAGLVDVDLVSYGRLRGEEHGEPREVWLFYGLLPGFLPTVLRDREVETGELRFVYHRDLHLWGARLSLRYLVPMAVSHDRGTDRAAFIEVTEAGQEGVLA